MYITDIGGTDTRFIALFYIKAYDTDSSLGWIYAIFQFFEIIFILLSGLLNMYTVYMALHSNTFHLNITLIYGIYMLHWFELITSRILVFPYQEALLPIAASPQKSDSLIVYSFDESVTIITSFQKAFFLLLGAGLRVRYMLLVCFALPCVAVERCCATWLIRDYEQKSRAYISVTLVFMSEVLATVGAYTVTYQIVSVFWLAITAAVLQIVSYIVVQYIKQRTKYFQQKCERSVDFYSLSVKFQITENVQSCKVVHILVIEVGIMIMTTAITILLADLNLISSDRTVFVFFIMEKLIHINPIFICTAVFCVKPHWFKRLLRLIPGRIGHRTHALEYAVDHPEHRCSQADVHFEQLRKLW
ncbi:unnamed protein product [Caenorhabditis brenneri]